MSSVQPAASAEPLRALIVEDDATNRRVMELILELRGVETAFARNGSEAVAACERESYDVVLMDLQMPVMDGFDAISGIRALETARRRRRTPILVVSAFTRGVDKARAAGAGADCHLGKPVNVPVLLGAIDDVAAGRDCRC